MGSKLLLGLFAVVGSVIFLTSVGNAFGNSVVAESPDYSLEITTKVISPDDCHGEKDDSHWEWTDEGCFLDEYPPDAKIRYQKYIFAAPLKQIKAGVALVDIQCNDGKHPIYKHDRMNAACVTSATYGDLIERGWAALRLETHATDDVGRDLCNLYQGQWDVPSRYCHGLQYPILCSMAGGDIMNDSCFIPNTDDKP